MSLRIDPQHPFPVLARGAGRTLRKTGQAVAPTMTLDRMTQDGIQLTEYMRKHLGKDDGIIVAHSFDTILYMRMARARPNLFYAYVGTGQVTEETKNYSAAAYAGISPLVATPPGPVNSSSRKFACVGALSYSWS